MKTTAVFGMCDLIPLSATLVCRSDGVVLAATDGACALLYRERANIVGENFQSLYEPPLRFESFVEFAHRCQHQTLITLNTPTGHCVRVRVCSAGEEPQVFVLSFYATPEPQKQPAGLVEGCHDTTEKDVRESRLRFKVDALEKLTRCAAAMFSRDIAEADWAHQLREVAEIVGADVFTHIAGGDQRWEFVFIEGLPESIADGLRRIDIRQTLCGRTLENELIDMSAELLQKDPIGMDLYAVGLRCFFAIPLIADGELVGGLSFGATTKAQFSPAEIKFLELVALVVTAARVQKLIEQSRKIDRNRYRQAAEHSRMIIWEANPVTADFTFVSGVAEELTGFSPEEWYQAGFWQSQLHPDDRVASVAICTNATAKKQNHRFEYRMLRKDGGIIWIDDIVEVITENGRVVKLRGTLIDITERKSLEQQLLQAQKMEAIGSLTSGIAHDFNNLLTVINSSCELLKIASLNEQVGFSPSILDMIGWISEAGQRATRLTDQLLLFSRSSVAQAKSVCVNLVIDNMRDLLQRLLGDEISVAIETAPNLPPVRIDPLHLEQALMNLAVNARDAMQQGGQLAIRTHFVPPGSATRHPQESVGKNGYVCLSVEDTGSGIPEEIRSRIFDPFFTTKPPGVGTGLGLSVAYGIVHSAGGYLNVEPRSDQGTRFLIFLPALSGEADLQTPVSQDVVIKGTEVILVVEDDQTVLQVIVASLKYAGYAVIGVPDAAAAKRLAATLEPPIGMLVTDISMPSITGPQLIKEIQEHPHYENLPMLFLSGHDQASLAKFGISPDSRNFLHKPFTIAGLTSKVRELLTPT